MAQTIVPVAPATATSEPVAAVTTVDGEPGASTSAYVTDVGLKDEVKQAVEDNLTGIAKSLFSGPLAITSLDGLRNRVVLTLANIVFVGAGVTLIGVGIWQATSQPRATALKAGGEVLDKAGQVAALAGPEGAAVGAAVSATGKGAKAAGQKTQNKVDRKKAK